jgi:hypothetical protein
VAAPFSSDLMGNLGLLELSRASRAGADAKQALARRAATRFESALALRPTGGPWARHLATARSLANPEAEPPSP